MPNKHFKRLASREYGKKIGFNDYVYDFSVDYDVITVDDIKDIQKYLMKKKKKKKCKWKYLDLLKKCFL